MSVHHLSNSAICPFCQQPVEPTSLLVDKSRGIVARNGKQVRFTPREFSIVSLLVERYPATVSKNSIYDLCLLDETGSGPEMKIMDVFICRIRPLLAEIGLVIETVWGTGYRLVETGADVANSVKESSLRSRPLKSAYRWRKEDDDKLKDLMRRKFKPAACANMMNLPYMTVERHYRRLMEIVDVKA